MLSRFSLAYREQQQLFLFDWDYVSATLFKVGGLSTLTARFIVQFFWNPAVALVLTLCLLALSSYILWVVIRSSRKDWPTIPLAMVPACFIGASLADNGLHFDFLISIIFVEAALLIYKNVRSRRTFWGILFTVILYILAGPTACLFALGACILDIKNSKGNKLFSLLYPAVFIACAAVAWFSAAAPTFVTAMSPSYFFDFDAAMPGMHWAGWAALLAVLAISIVKPNKVIAALSSSACFVASFAIASILSGNVNKHANLAGYEFEYYTVNSRWDDLVESCRSHEWTPLTSNYMNLSLAYKGSLTDNLMKYDQRGVDALLYMSETKTVDVRVAHIMYAMGNMAAAQDIAFNAMFTTEGYAPAMLEMNANIEFMRGSYSVADKYLSILERSIHYRKWALERRKFLWNDEAVGNDPELGNGRRDFPKEDGFAMFGNPVDELMRIVDANPADRKAMDYAVSFLLLAKDLPRLQNFVDRYWGSPALRNLPLPAQQALAFYSEYSRNVGGADPVSQEWCLQHGVSLGVFNSFAEFQQASLQANGAAPRGFRNTYWNYLIYTQI